MVAISRNNPTYLCALVVLGLLGLFSVWEAIFAAAFKVQPKFMQIGNLVIDMIFLCHIYLNFFVSFRDKNDQVVVERIPIAGRYIFWAIIDSVDVFVPLYLFMVAPSWKYATTVYCIRVLRLRKALLIYFRFEKISWTKYYSLRILFVALLDVHVSACLFYWIATLYGEGGKTWFTLTDNLGQTTFEKYVTSLYLSVTTFSTVGYGDLHPVAIWERFFGALLMMLNLGLGSYVATMVASTLFDEKPQVKKLRALMQVLRKIPPRRSLDLDFYMELGQTERYITATYEDEWGGINNMESLPKGIRSVLKSRFFSKVVEDVYLFKDLPPPMLSQLVWEVQVEYFPKGVDIMLENEMPTHMYMLFRGSVRVSSSDGHNHAITVGERGIFGEVGVVAYKAQPFAVHCDSDDCILLSLSRDVLLKIIRLNGDASARILVNNCLKIFEGHTSTYMTTLRRDMLAQRANSPPIPQ